MNAKVLVNEDKTIDYTDILEEFLYDNKYFIDGIWKDQMKPSNILSVSIIVEEPKIGHICMTLQNLSIFGDADGLAETFDKNSLQLNNLQTATIYENSDTGWGKAELTKDDILQHSDQSVPFKIGNQEGVIGNIEVKDNGEVNVDWDDKNKEKFIKGALKEYIEEAIELSFKKEENDESSN